MSKQQQPERGRKAGKNSCPTPRTWEDVNQHLACLGEMERQIRGLQNQFDEKVAVLKQQWLEASQPIAREKEKLEEQIECFYWAHRADVIAAGRKSVELDFGRLGSRHSRTVAVEDVSAAQQWLQQHNLGRYLRVRTELDREALRSALLGGADSCAGAAELLSCPGIRLREREQFWYEVASPRPAVLPDGSRLSKEVTRSEVARAPFHQL